MASKMFKCPHCGRDNFKNQRGLTQHQASSKMCRGKARAMLGDDSGFSVAHQYLPTTTVARSKTHNLDSISAFLVQTMQEDALARAKLGTKTNESANELRRLNPTTDQHVQLGEFHASSQESSDYEMPFQLDSDSDESFISDDSQETEVAIADTSLRATFVKCVEDKTKTTCNMTQTQVNCIKLMSTLRKTTASLNAHESTMTWYLRSTNQINQHQNASDSTSHLSKQKLIKFVTNRH